MCFAALDFAFRITLEQCINKHSLFPFGRVGSVTLGYCSKGSDASVTIIYLSYFGGLNRKTPWLAHEFHDAFKSAVRFSNHYLSQLSKHSCLSSNSRHQLVS